MTEQETERDPQRIFSVAYARYLLALPFLALALILREWSDMLAHLGTKIAGGLPDEPE